MPVRGKQQISADQLYNVRLRALHGDFLEGGTPVDGLDDFMVLSPIANRMPRKSKQIQANYDALIETKIAKRKLIMAWYAESRLGEAALDERAQAVASHQALVNKGELEGLEWGDDINELIAMSGLDDLRYVDGKHKVIEILGDGFCSARSVMFGALISASVAIKNRAVNEVKAQAMEKTLTIMLNDARALRELYKSGSPALETMNRYFPFACNTVINLIEAVLTDKVSTTELVFQANIDASLRRDGDEVLNYAMAELSQYMTYTEAKDNPGLAEYIRPGTKAARDLLVPHYSYSTAERSLLCEHLCIGSQTVLVDTGKAEVSLVIESRVKRAFNDSKRGDAKVDDTYEQLPDVSFTTVTSMAGAVGHTNLVLDASILAQMKKEEADRHEFKHLQESLKGEDGNQYVKLIGPQDELEEYTRQFEIYGIDEPEFYNYLYNQDDSEGQRLGSFFIFSEKMRKPHWAEHHEDILFKFEQELRTLYTGLQPKNDTERQNKAIAGALLDKIYSGELPPPLIDYSSENKTFEFTLGGTNQSQREMVRFELASVSPEQQQALEVLIAGIEQTEIDQGWIRKTRQEDDQDKVTHDFDNLILYLQKMIALVPSPTKELLARDIKTSLTKYAQGQINAMPNHHTAKGELGYNAYMQEFEAIKTRFIRFNTLINMFDIRTHHSEYEALTMEQVDKFSPEDTPKWSPPNTLEKFEESINSTDQAKIGTWKKLLQTERTASIAQTDEIRKYFKSIVEEINKLINPANEDDVEEDVDVAKQNLERATKLVENFSAFVKTMQKHAIPFGERMMEDAAKLAKKLLKKKVDENQLADKKAFNEKITLFKCILKELDAAAAAVVVDAAAVAVAVDAAAVDAAVDAAAVDDAADAVDADAAAAVDVDVAADVAADVAEKDKFDNKFLVFQDDFNGFIDPLKSTDGIKFCKEFTQILNPAKGKSKVSLTQNQNLLREFLEDKTKRLEQTAKLDQEKNKLKTGAKPEAKPEAKPKAKSAEPKKAGINRPNFSFLMSLWNNEFWQDPDLVAFVESPAVFYAGAFIFVVGAIALTVFTCGVGTFGLGMGLLLAAGLVAGIGALLAAPGTYRGTKAASEYTYNRFFVARAAPIYYNPYDDSDDEEDDVAAENITDDGSLPSSP